MKHLPKLLLFLPLFLLLVLIGCKKKVDEPKVTTYNNLQFATKINGVDFIPRGSYTSKPIKIEYRSNSITSGLNLYILVVGSNNIDLEVYLRDFKGVGVYPLNSKTNGYPSELDPPSYGQYTINDSPSQYWRTNAGEVGSVTITDFTISTNKLRGNFSFKAENSTDHSIKEVTNGFFGVN